MKFGQQFFDDEVSRAGYLFTIMVLFLPTNSFYLFYSVLAVGLFLLLWGSKGVFPWRSEIFYIYIGVLIFLISLSLFRAMFFYNLEDFKELSKVIIFVTVIFFGVRVRAQSLEFIFSVFVVINCAVALFQYLGFYGLGIREITDLYNAKGHVGVSLSYSAPRALGLSSGPGQQSVVGLFFFSYFLVLYFFGGGGYKRLGICLIALLSAVLSQSKTALIAIAIGSAVVALLFVAHAGYKGKLVMIVFSILTLGGVIAFKGQILFLFPEYARLLAQGGNVSSLHGRFWNWSQMLDVLLGENSLFFYLFGVGRSGMESHGVNDLPYDSDYLYILINYGLVGLFLLLALIAWFLARGFLFFSRENVYGKILIVALIYGSISAVALNYYFEPRVMVLFAIIISRYLFVSRRCSI